MSVVAGCLGVVLSIWACARVPHTVASLRDSGPVWADRNLSRHPVVVVACPVVMGAVMWILSEPVFGLFVWATVRYGLIDLDTHAVPTIEARWVSVVGYPLLVGGTAWTGSSPVDIIVGAMVSTIVVVTVRFASRGDLGAGDVALAPLLGMHAGWFGWTGAMVGLASGFLIAGVFAAVAVSTGRLDRRSHIPMVPFLFAGTWIAVLR